MAGTNDFLPIGTAGGANVETQVAYAADPVRLPFYADAAIPAAKVHGKMLRQQSVIVSQFAQMLADYSNLNMLDDGNLATILANMKTQFRIRLLAPITFYIATTGNDTTGNGTIGNPWRTAQKAYLVLRDSYDINGYDVTIMRAAGTYTDNVGVSGQLVGQGSGLIIFDGASAATVIVNCANPNYSSNAGASIKVQNQTLNQSVNFTLIASRAGILQYGNVIFGTLPAGGSHVNATNGGVIIQFTNYTITGGGGAHFSSDGAGMVILPGGLTVTLTGTPAFTGGFALAQRLGLIQDVLVTTFVGAATGGRYAAVSNGVIDTNGQGVNHYPGSSAGATSTGGQYLP